MASRANGKDVFFQDHSMNTSRTDWHKNLNVFEFANQEFARALHPKEVQNFIRAKDMVNPKSMQQLRTSGIMTVARLENRRDLNNQKDVLIRATNYELTSHALIHKYENTSDFLKDQLGSVPPSAIPKGLKLVLDSYYTAE